jgi:hypothetical protein
MKAVATGFLMAMASTCAVAVTDNFDGATAGSLPAGWSAGVTGRGASQWAVASDPSAPSAPHVLTQSATGTFPWCIRSGVAITDGFVEVKFRAISGKDDQAGGVVWRWKDGNNYYVARANALENNVSLYYTENGSRKTIKYVDAPVPRAAWHVLRVDFSGRRIKVTLNGKTYIDVEDNHIGGQGSVGLWTKADSVTSFDDFSYGDSAAR